MKKLIKDMKDLKNRSLKYMKNFLEGNKKNFDIPANESDGIAYNILIRKDKLYADYENPDYEIDAKSLSLDELEHLFMEMIKWK